MGMTTAERGALALAALAVMLVAAALVGTRRDRLQRLAIVTTVLTFVLVVFGAYVRLNDAGLGCPDWPGCYGNFTPDQASDAIQAAQAQNPAGPVSLPKAWKEMLHRYLAMLVGCFIVALAIAAWRSRRRFDAPYGLAMSALAVVVLQGAFGALTVTLLLKPAIVTTHLAGGLTVLALLALTARRLGPAPAVDAGGRRALRGPATLAAAALLVQILLGGWVSTNYAAAACGDLPLCQDHLAPQADFATAFNPFRELGRTASGANLPLPALTAIHMAHRGFAIVAFAALIALAWRAGRTRGSGALGVALALAVCVQVALGIGIVAAMSPDHLAIASQLAVAAGHNAGAAVLVVLLTMLNFHAWSSGDVRAVDPGGSHSGEPDPARDRRARLAPDATAPAAT